MQSTRISFGKRTTVKCIVLYQHDGVSCCCSRSNSYSNITIIYFMQDIGYYFSIQFLNYHFHLISVYHFLEILIRRNRNNNNLNAIHENTQNYVITKCNGSRCVHNDWHLVRVINMSLNYRSLFLLVLSCEKIKHNEISATCETITIIINGIRCK